MQATPASVPHQPVQPAKDLDRIFKMQPTFASVLARLTGSQVIFI
jgi:hypothetical protein